MTLKDYRDNVETSLRLAGFTRDEIPRPEFLRRLINQARTKVAIKTECLQDWVKTTSEATIPDYKKPETCLKILDVYYDGRLLDYVTPFEMNYFRQSTSTGTPTKWTYYGADDQPEGFIYLYGTPDSDDKEIKMQAVVLTVDLAIDSDECELGRIYQTLVVDAVFAVLMRTKGNRQWLALQGYTDKEIERYVNLRVL